MNNIVFFAKNLKTGKDVQFSLDDLYGYEGEVAGVFIRGCNTALNYNSGYGFEGMNPDLQIYDVAMDGKRLHHRDKLTFVPIDPKAREIVKQARLEQEKNGCVTVVCPKCHKQPVVTTTPGGERRYVNCECGYLHDGEIFF